MILTCRWKAKLNYERRSSNWSSRMPSKGASGMKSLMSQVWQGLIQPSLWPVGGNRSTQRKSTSFSRALTDSFHISVIMSPQQELNIKMLALTIAPQQVGILSEHARKLRVQRYMCLHLIDSKTKTTWTKPSKAKFVAAVWSHKSLQQLDSLKKIFL
jgi:hypothetical protein